MAIVQQEFKNERNILIIFSDFKMIDGIVEKANNFFDLVYVLEGMYPASNKTWKSKAKKLPQTINAIHSILYGEEYNRLFYVCDDAVPEIYILKELKKRNKYLYVAWIEDGSFPYYDNHVPGNGLNKNIISRTFRLIIGRILFGKYYSYNGTTIASNNWIDEYWVTYPKAVREKFKNRQLKEIKPLYFQNSIKSLYKGIQIDLNNRSILIAMDKIDVYKNRELVEKALNQLIEKANAYNMTVYYKYHPKEESSVIVLDKCTEVPRNIGIEGILATNLGKQIIIFGIKSTSLQTSSICGFRTISLAELVDEADPDIQKFYRKLDIKILHEWEEINNLFSGY